MKNTDKEELFTNHDYQVVNGMYVAYCPKRISFFKDY